MEMEIRRQGSGGSGMTTHDKDKIIAATIGCIEGPYDRSRAITITGNEIERLYAIAYEAGRVAGFSASIEACQAVGFIPSQR